jgi:hypothetical protein
MSQYHWVGPEEAAGLPAPADCRPADEAELCFAAEHAAGELHLFADLRADDSAAPPPSLTLTLCAAARLGPLQAVAPGTYRVEVVVPAAPAGTADDEVVLRLVGAGVTPARVRLRRTAWSIDPTLVVRQRHGPPRPAAPGQRPRNADPLAPQTRAALLWHGWRRFTGLVALKCFETGLSGSDVLVAQPQLAGPPGADPGWGSCLLVKTGPVRKVREEWDRFRTHLADRLHPFLGRCEHYLTVRPAGPPEPDVRVTLLGSFLGGDLLQVEPLEDLVRGPEDADACLGVLARLYALLQPWHAAGRTAPLGEWKRVFTERDGRLLLFGKYDLAEERGNPAAKVRGRADYAAPLSFDPAFITRDHLRDHLLGSARRKGLLRRLMEDVRVKFSLTHGDLHPRNVLADEENVWLLDFGEAGPDAPTLYDFAKLEVYLRVWCLELSPAAKEVDDGAAQFERHLLDVLFGTASGRQPIHAAAAKLGADPATLCKAADCIAWLRRRALAHGIGGPQRRDYLAILYLTTLQALSYAGEERGRTANFRLLVTLACLLEGLLSRLVGLEPFNRGRHSLDPTYLVTPDWLAAPGAAARVAYVMRRRDGRKALPFLAATCGVLQSAVHHLDVFDHTLLVLVNLEEVLRDPLGALSDPPAFERRVARALRRQRLPFDHLRHRGHVTDRPDLVGLEVYFDAIRELLRGCLTDEGRLLVKWTALLHDVGKPASRCLQEGAGGRLAVQFRGHEAYSAFAVAGHLEQWFPDAAVRGRLDRLIRDHHFHHNLVTHFVEEGRLDRLRREVVAGEDGPEVRWLHDRLDPAREEYRADVPLLLLHGFADMAACVGSRQLTPLAKAAELDVLLLAACARYPEAAARAAAKAAEQALKDGHKRRVQEAARALRVRSGKGYGDLLRDVTARVEERVAAAAPPSDDELRAWVLEAAARLGLGPDAA